MLSRPTRSGGATRVWTFSKQNWENQSSVINVAQLGDVNQVLNLVVRVVAEAARQVLAR